MPRRRHLYHGTTQDRVSEIIEDGLDKYTYLTEDKSYAARYAIMRAAQRGQRPALLEIIPEGEVIDLHSTSRAFMFKHSPKGKITEVEF